MRSGSHPTPSLTLNHPRLPEWQTQRVEAGPQTWHAVLCSGFPSWASVAVSVKWGHRAGGTLTQRLTP